MYSMQDILSDKGLFEDRFLAHATRQKLGEVSSENLRLALLALQRFGRYPAYSTQRFWTPIKRAEPIVTIGCLSKNGAIRKTRFGLCAGDVCADGAGAGFLHIWTDEQTIRSFLDGYLGWSVFRQSFWGDWKPWRPESSREQLRMHVVPAIDADGNLDFLKEDTDQATQEFFAFLERKIKAGSGALDALSPLLQETGHQPDAITPYILDAYRHADDDATDEGEVTIDDIDPIEAQAASQEAPPVFTAVRKETSPELDYTVTTFEAADCFKVTVRDDRAPAPFMNWCFKPRYSNLPEAIGCGLYGLFFRPPSADDAHLIYVGLFKNGNHGDPFGGDIFARRWWTHLAGMTMRDYRVSVANQTADFMRIERPERALSTFAQAPVRERVVRQKNVNCSAGLRRVLFADDHWEILSTLSPNEALACFSFEYVQLERPQEAYEPDAIRAQVKAAERKAIERLRPRCNKETPLFTGRTGVDAREFADKASSALLGR